MPPAGRQAVHSRFQLHGMMHRLTRGDGFTVPSLDPFRIVPALLVVVALQGCAAVTVAGAAVTVAATAFSIIASAAETTVDVAAAGVDAVVGEEDGEDTDEED